MNAIVKVPFEGDEIECVKDERGVWVSIARGCERLKIDHRSQLKKLKTKAWATVALITTVAEDGKERELSMLHIDGVPMWLATIDPSRVAPDVRSDLERYQTRCAKVLRDHFAAPKPPPVVEIPNEAPAAGLVAYREGAALLDAAVEAELLGKRDALVRKIKLFRGEAGVDLFAAPEETFEPLPDALAKTVTGLNPGDSIEANVGGRRTMHFAPPVIPADHMLASTVAKKFEGVTDAEVRAVARALGVWQKEPEWGMFDGMNRKTGLPEPGTGGFYLSPKAVDLLAPHLARVGPLKAERLSYVKALEAATQAGPDGVASLAGAEGDDLRALVRELTKPAKKAAAG